MWWDVNENQRIEKEQKIQLVAFHKHSSNGGYKYIVSNIATKYTKVISSIMWNLQIDFSSSRSAHQQELLHMASSSWLRHILENDAFFVALMATILWASWTGMGFRAEELRSVMF